MPDKKQISLPGSKRTAQVQLERVRMPNLGYFPNHTLSYPYFQGKHAAKQNIHQLIFIETP